MREYLSDTFSEKQHAECLNYFNDLFYSSKVYYNNDKLEIKGCAQFSERSEYARSSKDHLGLISKANSSGKAPALYKLYIAKDNTKDISNLVHEILGDSINSLGTFESEYDHSMRIKGGRVNDKVHIDPKHEFSGYSHIVNFKNEKRTHRNKVDWASTILSGSKILMYNLCKVLGHDEIIYGDTDSAIVDGVHALKPIVRDILFDKNALAINIEFIILPFAYPGCTLLPLNVIFAAAALKFSYSNSPT